MKRYVLRFRGAGAKPAADVARILALPRLRVVDDPGGRMMLVEAPESALPVLIRSLPEWALAEERRIPLPDPRPKLRAPA